MYATTRQCNSSGISLLQWHVYAFPLFLPLLSLFELTAVRAIDVCPPPLQRLSYYTLIGAFLVSTMSFVVSGGDGQVAWAGMLLLSFVAFERVSGGWLCPGTPSCIDKPHGIIANEPILLWCIYDVLRSGSCGSYVSGA